MASAVVIILPIVLLLPTHSVLWALPNEELVANCGRLFTVSTYSPRFAVDAVPLSTEDITDSYDPVEGDDILAPEQSRRLSELFDLRDRRPLTEEEQVELNVLVAA